MKKTESRKSGGNRYRQGYLSLASAVTFMTALGSVACAVESPEAEDFEISQKSQAISAGRVVAYVDGTTGSIDSSKLSAGKYTHINYAFANLDAWGNVYFTYGQQDINIINQIKALKSSNPSLKIIMAIGGWTWSDHFSSVMGDAGKRANFVSTAWNLANTHGFDGIEIDWEFPGYGGEAGNSICAGTCDGNRFVTMLQDLKNAKPAGKELSFAGGASPNMGANVNLGTAASLTDFITIMTYDFHGDWGEPWGHHANLYGGDISVDSAVNMYLNEGVPASKTVVGLPFYGRSWSAPNVPGGAPLYKDINCNGTASGAWCTFYGYGGTLGYDNNLKAAYINTGSQWVSFDNTVSMGWKLDYINNRSLGGAMYWSAMQDKSNLELTNLVWSKIGGSGGTPPPPSGTAATVYQHCSYSGYSASLAPGDYSLSQLNALGIANDDISSIKVAPGYQAVLYQHSDFKGFAGVHTGDTSCLVNSTIGRTSGTWNDDITTVRIQPIVGNGNYELKNVGSNLCIDVSAGSLEPNANIQLWNCNGSGAQRFTLTRFGNAYEVKRAGTSMCMDVAYNSPDNGANILQYNCTGGNAQRFFIVALGNSQYELRHVNPGTRCMDAAGAGTTNGTNIHQWDCYQNGAQKVYLNPK